jgi:hypothetical protein
MLRFPLQHHAPRRMGVNYFSRMRIPPTVADATIAITLLMLGSKQCLAVANAG